jgi:hypothetical protein
MVTIAWNPLGFHLLEALPKGRIFNLESYRDNFLTALIQLLREPGGGCRVIHADDARPQIAQECRALCADNGLRLVIHPLYSPDRAPSHFFRFGHVKNRLHGITFQSHDESLAGIVAVFSQVPIETLQRVFEHWMERLEWVSQNNGDYYP